jgi:hypothetical protein
MDQLNDVRAKVEEELGGPGSSATDGPPHAAGAGEHKAFVEQQERPEHPPLRIRTFLCVTPDNLVAGYLTIEPVRSDVVLELPVEGEQKLPDVSNDETEPSADAAVEGNDARADGKAEGWHMGIRHIWVGSSWRRKGVATALIRAASLVFAVAGGCAVAFSQPTTQGSLLAASVLGAKTHIPAYR